MYYIYIFLAAKITTKPFLKAANKQYTIRLIVLSTITNVLRARFCLCGFIVVINAEEEDLLWCAW